MIGSTLIYEQDESKLKTIDIDDLDSLVTLELDSLLTLDFETICQQGNVSWIEGEPLQYDEASGVAIFPVSRAGIIFVCTYSGELNETQIADQENIKKFIEDNGSDNIYELATF